MNKKLKKEITRMRIPRYESRINENCEKILKKKKDKVIKPAEMPQ